MSQLAGTGQLVRWTARRDRVRLACWLVGIVVLVLVTAASTKGIYDTQADLDDAAAVAVDNPAALAFNGPAQALDTIGGQVAFQLGAFGLLLVGLMAVLLVGRVTRGEEDSGRLELVRSMPVGRHAPLGAGLVLVVGALVLLGAAVAAALLSQGLPVTGSLVLGASYTAFGWVFVGVTAVTAQASENPRVASGAAGGVLGLTFALRAVGDVGTEALSWLSPMGWAQRARPYAGERRWPIAMLVVLGGALVAGAVRLAEHRDFGAGLVASRPGPARAGRSLSTPLGMAVRLNRAAVAWWAIGVVALGLVYGSLADSIVDFIAENDSLEEVVAGYGGADLIDSYLATSLLVVALVAAGPGLQVAMRLRSEESALRAEALLATPTSRRRWLASHAVTALAGGAVATVLGGAAVGAGYAVTGGGAGELPRMVGAALVYVPAVWLLTGLAVALFGVAPRWAPAIWGALAVCFVVAMFGPLLDLPGWVLDVSPFQHIPALPAASMRWLPVVVVAAVAAGLLGAGAAAFRRRDLAGA
jgi:ABC-2 type transport system permease protein